MPIRILGRERRPPSLVVDEPTAAIDVVGGTVLVRGWAVDRDTGDPGVVTVAIGDDLEVAARRTPRPDVATAEGLADASPVGFVAALDRRTLPTRGALTVRATFTGGRIDASPVTFTNVVPEPVPTIPVQRCPVCASPARQGAGSSDGLRMARCLECAVVYTVDRPEPGFVAARYSAAYFADEYLPALEASHDEMTGHWDALLDRLDSHRHDGARLFEIGCGAGRFLVAAQQRGWAVAGADINEAAVDHARDELGLDVRWGSADEPLGDGPYHAIVSEMSLEHMTDPPGVMRAMTAALAPGGTVLVFTVSAEGPSFTELGMASPLVGPAEHLLLFSDRSLRRLATDAGLQVVETWTDELGDGIGLLARRAG